MSITFDKENFLFNLSTQNTSYIICIYKGHFPVHVHYGRKVADITNVDLAFPRIRRAFSPDDLYSEKQFSTDTLPMEYPFYGSCDFRSPAFHAQYADGSRVTVCDYEGYEFISGKPAIDGLPATYEDADGECETLKIFLKDNLKRLKITLCYSVFADKDIITRNVIITNESDDPIRLSRTLSMAMDFQGKDFDFIHLYGAWANERHIQRSSLINGAVTIDSKRGASSHQHNPSFALVGKNTTEDMGDAYGFGLVYSGNFIAGAEVDQYDVTRAFMGINPFNGGWMLEKGESFNAPEVIMTYSANGMGQMSRNFHSIIRNNLIRGKYKKAERPVLINNWEATYFNFDEEKILKIAKKAKEADIDLMVLDDGWFGKRNNDATSLGDWFVNEEKLPGGLKSLAEKVNALGMQFGLWFEPEMISVESELYKAHPDWCIHIEGRHRSEARQQLVLDLSRRDVKDYIIKSVCDILASAPISYVKWDMNRHLTEVGSAMLEPERQMELNHRFVLGLYEVLEAITSRFPDVLFEGCAGGGGRFDLGMLYYHPQIWTSDDSDAIERLYIQHGTSLLYPASAMGAHVSAVPNHQVGRVTPINTRGNVAMAGQFGYELDLNNLPEDEFEAVKEQVKLYKKIRHIMQQGDLYRLASPYESDHATWQYISEDKKEIALFYTIILGKPSTRFENIRLQNLDPDAIYVEQSTGNRYTGEMLMNIGLFFQDNRDFRSELLIFEKK